MERLTYWCDNGHGGGKWFVAIDAEGREDYGPHVDRLAAYEETGLEPGEIEQLKGEAFGLRVDKQELEQYRALGPIDRLRELAQADREGRCVILPCKRGDTVWFIKSAFSVAAFPIEANHVSIRGIDCDGDVLYAAITDYNKIERHFKSSDISKTVFLTRAEAEAALRREQDGQIKP